MNLVCCGFWTDSKLDRHVPAAGRCRTASVEDSRTRQHGVFSVETPDFLGGSFRGAVGVLG